MPATLFALFLATFGIATTELAVVGILPEISADLNLPIPTTGLLVSAYAAGVAIGSPIISLLMAATERKRTLLLLMGLFVFGHILSATAHTFMWLLVARVISAVCHASFLGIAAVVAAGTVSPEQSGRAVSKVWLGFSAASLVGIPGMAAIGHLISWRATFWPITGIGIIATLAIAIWVPGQASDERSDVAREIRPLGRTQVLLAMAMSLLVCASTFSVLAYIAPFLASETGVLADRLPYMLFAFGVGGTLGLLCAGGISASNQLTAVLVLFGAQAFIDVTLIVIASSALLAGLALALWGFCFLAPCVPLQTRVVQEAKEAPNLASTLNQSAFNVGNALGPSLGAAALYAAMPYRYLPALGAVVALCGASLAGCAIALARKPTRK